MSSLYERRLPVNPVIVPYFRISAGRHDFRQRLGGVVLLGHVQYTDHSRLRGGADGVGRGADADGDRRCRPATGQRMAAAAASPAIKAAHQRLQDPADSRPHKQHANPPSSVTAVSLVRSGSVNA